MAGAGRDGDGSVIASTQEYDRVVGSERRVQRPPGGLLDGLTDTELGDEAHEWEVVSRPVTFKKGREVRGEVLRLEEEKHEVERRLAFVQRELEQTRAKLPRGMSTS